MHMVACLLSDMTDAWLSRRLSRSEPAKGAEKPSFIRKQEKGVLAKGVSTEASVTLKKHKYPRIVGLAVHLGTQSATAKGGVHFAESESPP